MYKFIKRIWNLYNSSKIADRSSEKTKIRLNKTIKKATDDLSKLRYNTTLASFMEFLNVWEEEGQTMSKEDTIAFLKLLAPFAPHMTEEIFHTLGNTGTIHKEKWPSFDPTLIAETNQVVAVQVNGKLRTTLILPSADAGSENRVVEAALKDQSIRKYVQNRLQVKKIIFVPGKILNLVV
ncbi:MAG: class I tRNA ligase family protein [Patescibacteria group bacterium]|nr:class I tRNA ligase family protein [Patescibacteria group bacterium]